MKDKRYVFCGDATKEGVVEDAKRDLRLRLSGQDGQGNITLRVEDIHSRMFKGIPPAFHDLMEIATYVYCADQAIKRAADDVDRFGNGWRRDLHFVIPVRQLDLWRSTEVTEALCSTLNFLSDDNYTFDFVHLEKSRPVQEYLGFNDEREYYGNPQQIVMFSGGLDSLAGAIEEAVTQKNKIVLVTHKSTSKTNTRYRTLEEKLRAKAGANAPRHITIRVHKSKNLNREYTQRTRSFLFVSLGATIAKMLGLTGVRFYENGVVSLNLPVRAQVVGGRATRTTHPVVMRGFQRILSLVAGEPFRVDNPFFWKTKAEIVESIMKAGCQEMIGESRSCAHTWEMPKGCTHCGGCSQCIDRRYAIIAAKAEQYDPLDAYAVDVFTQSRDKDEDKILAAAYLERANQVRDMTDLGEFISRFSEVTRAFRALDESPTQAAQKIFDLYRRHGAEVSGAMELMIQRNVTAIVKRTLPGDCLLRTAYESGSTISVPSVTTIITEPENYFRKWGDVWTARFQGRKGFALKGVDKGAEYINILLAYPDRESSISEVMFACAAGSMNPMASTAVAPEDIEEGFSISDGPLLTDAGVVADPKAVAQYKARFKELLVEKADAESEGDETLLEAINDEMEQIVAAITGAVGKGGKPRKLGDKKKNVRDAFRNAINRAVDHIETHDSLFATHLREALQLTSQAAYKPGYAIEWDVRPITNE